MAASLLGSRLSAPQALSRRAPRAVRCSAVGVRASAGAVPRRALLSTGAALALALASPLAAFADDDAEFTPVAQLSTPYRKFQRNEFQKVLMTELKAQAKDLDSRALMRLLFNDAATGAHNGSVHFRRAKDATPVCGDMRAARQLAGAADGRTLARARRIRLR